METRLQVSAIHEAGHAAVADFLGFRVTGISLLPEGRSPGSALAHTNVAGEREGTPWATVLAAGEEAVRLVEAGDRPAPAMPEARPWHTRVVSIGESAGGHGFQGDREELEGVDSERAAFARESARRILSEDWGAVYGLADQLLREGVLGEDAIRSVLRPGSGQEAREVIYDASASSEGLLWGPGMAPPGTTEERGPERHVRPKPRPRRRGGSPVPTIMT